MTIDFLKRASFAIKYGISVVPGYPGEKFSRMLGWPKLATTDMEQVHKWQQENPEFNRISVPKFGQVLICDIDDPTVLKKLPRELPLTLKVYTPSGGLHVYFKATPASDAIGNRDVVAIGDYQKLDATGKPTCLFELKAHDKTAASPGSVTDKGFYNAIDKSPLCAAPQWLLDWVDEHSKMKRTPFQGSKTKFRKVHPDFEPDDFYEWYAYKNAFEICNTVDKDGFSVDLLDCGCLFKGDFHQQSTETGFLRWDDGGFGWKCFAAGCDGENASITDVMDYLEGEGFERYPNFIYEDEDDNLLLNNSRFQVEVVTNEPKGNATENLQTRVVPDEEVVPKKNLDYNFRLTDTGNAERLVRRFGSLFRYVRDVGEWRVYNKKAWTSDKTGMVERCSKKVAQEIFLEAADHEDEARRDALLAWAKNSESRERRNAMDDLASKERAVVSVIEDYDKDPWLFNVNNGIINLRTGLLAPHDPAMMMSKISPVIYDPDAKCPLWDKFLARVQGNDQEMVDFLSRAVGYTLTGDTSIQALFFLYGDGCNGKSVFTSIIRHLMGSYGDNASFDTFVVQKNSGAIRNDLAKLVGARFVTASEAQDGNRLDEALIKSLTGQDPVTTRFLHKEFFTYVPQFKIWMSSNYKPSIRGLDWGIWRRVKMIPFEVTIPDDERDETLTEKLKVELPGILNWALKGLADFQKFGLMYPEKVNAATKQYRDSQDIIGQFIAARCVNNPEASIKASELYTSFRNWAESAKEFVMKERQFGDAMKKRGVEDTHKKDGKHYLGLARLATEYTPQKPDAHTIQDVDVL